MTLLRPVVCLLLLVITGIAPLTAQQTIPPSLSLRRSDPLVPPQRLVPTAQPTCTLSDSLLRGAPRAATGKAIVGGGGGPRWISAGEHPNLYSDARGIIDEEFVIQGDSAAGPDSATVQLDIKAIGGSARPIEQRQGTLIVDDSIQLGLGTMTEDLSPSLTFPNGTKVWNLYAMAPRGSLLQLTRARKIRLQLGKDHVDLSRELQDDLRAALAAYVCHH